MKLKTLVKPLLYFFTIFLILIIALFTFNNTLLTKHKPIDAKILVIEGWLPVTELENLQKLTDLNKYQEIIIAGLSHHTYSLDNLNKHYNNIKSVRLPATLYHNGILYLNSERLNELAMPDSIIRLTIFASGSEAISRSAYFSVFINSTYIGGGFTGKETAPFTYSISQNLYPIKSIGIHYGNDITLGKIDRNLSIDSVILNKVTLKNEFYLAYTNTLGIKYLFFPFISSSEYDAVYLKSLGITQDLTVLDTLYDGRNRTYIEALKLRSYLEQKYKSIPSINLVSIDGHSRRSFISYQTALGRKASIGIISFKDETKSDPLLQEIFYNLAEHFKLFISYLIYAGKIV